MDRWADGTSTFAPVETGRAAIMTDRSATVLVGWGRAVRAKSLTDLTYRATGTSFWTCRDATDDISYFQLLWRKRA